MVTAVSYRPALRAVVERRNWLHALQLVFVTCRAVPACAPRLLRRQKSASTLVPAHLVGTYITRATNFELLLQVCKNNLAGRKPSLSLSPCNLWCCKKAAVASPVCGVRARPTASTPWSLWDFGSDKLRRRCPRWSFWQMSCPLINAYIYAPAWMSATFCCYETN